MSSARRRFLYFSALLSLTYVALEVRLFHLQVLRHPAAMISTERMRRSTEISLSARGRIEIRNHYVLAESVPALDLYTNSRWTRGRTDSETPAVRDRIARQLEEIMGDGDVDIRARLDRAGYRRLLRHPLRDGEQILALFRDKRRGLLPGVELEKTWVRTYPEGQLAANVVGFVNGEGKGQAGIEQRMEPQLRGASAARRLLRDASGRPLVDLGCSLDEALPGADVELTLDLVIQYFTEEALDQIMVDHRPRWAAVVVLEPRTGDILAMASRPTFDPNQYGSFPQSHHVNAAVSYCYRPGSSFKPFMMGIILDAAAVRLDERIDCRRFNLKGRTIRDAHPHQFLTPVEIMTESSNIGMSKLALRLVPDESHPRAVQMAGLRRIYTTLRRLGFGKKPRSHMPATSAGIFSNYRNWSRVYTVPSLSFGHEIAVSPLQLAAAFQVFCHDGSYVEPGIVERAVRANGALVFGRSREKHRVFDRLTTRRVREMLVGVVDRGTGAAARIDGYSVAGKTSTARWEEDPKRYTSSFVGFAPASDPRLLVAVVVDQPTGAMHSGGRVAAPAAGEILERSLFYLGVHKDRMDSPAR